MSLVGKTDSSNDEKISKNFLENYNFGKTLSRVVIYKARDDENKL